MGAIRNTYWRGCGWSWRNIRAQEHGLLINVTRGKVIRLLPPLTLERKEVEMIVRAIIRLLD